MKTLNEIKKIIRKHNQELMQKHVDLIPKEDLRPELKDSILKEAVNL